MRNSGSSLFRKCQYAKGSKVLIHVLWLLLQIMLVLPLIFSHFLRPRLTGSGHRPLTTRKSGLHTVRKNLIRFQIDQETFPVKKHLLCWFKEYVIPPRTLSLFLSVPRSGYTKPHSIIILVNNIKKLLYKESRYAIKRKKGQFPRKLNTNSIQLVVANLKIYICKFRKITISRRIVIYEYLYGKCYMKSLLGAPEACEV